MQRLGTFATILALTLISFKAMAQTTPAPDDMFKDWQTMRAYLSSQGVDPVSINWTDIDTLCNGLKMHVSEQAYNKCAFEKAKDFTLFTKEKSQCDIQAKGLYPDSVMNGYTTTVTETGKDGVPHTYQRTISKLSTESLTQQRVAAAADCLKKLGWNDTNDWHTGKLSCSCP